MTITYRSARPEDAAALIDYLKTVGGETDNLTFGAEGLPISAEQERQYLERIQNDPCNRLFLALDGDRIVGDSSLNGSTRPRVGHRMELGITVLQKYWGRGVGSGLMEQMIAYAKGLGMHSLFLKVRSDNARAKGLYRKFGFVQCGTLPGDLQVSGVFYDTDIMVLRL